MRKPEHARYANLVLLILIKIPPETVDINLVCSIFYLVPKKERGRVLSLVHDRICGGKQHAGSLPQAPSIT